MKKSMTDQPFFFTLLLLMGFLFTFYMLYGIFAPFLSSLMAAGMIALVFYPLYERILKETGNRSNLASLMMCFFLTFFVLLPVVILSMLVFQQILDSAETINSTVADISFERLVNHPRVTSALEYIERFVNLETLNIKEQLIKAAEQVSQFMLAISTGFFLLFSNFLITALLVEINLFFLFRDGKRFVNYVQTLLPLSNDTQSMLGRRIYEIVQTSVIGSFATAATNGLMGGIAFAVMGLSAPILWGVIMAILSFLPLVGPLLIWGPTAIYLMFTGYVMSGLIMIAWCSITMLGFADYMVRPLLMNRISSQETQLHPLVLFLSVFGGIQVYGVLGLVMGPLIVVVALTSLEIYRQYFHIPVPRPLTLPKRQRQGQHLSAAPTAADENVTLPPESNPELT